MSEIDSMKMMEEADTTSATSVAYDDETIIWEGRPSQWVNLGTFIWWAVFLIASIYLIITAEDRGLYLESASLIDKAVHWGCYSLMAISILSIIYAYLSVHYEYTVITRNKIKEAKGITNIFRQELFCEISDIKDVKSPAAGLLGLLGLSSVVIETNDDDQPIIKIRAIKNRDVLINKLLPIWRELKMERKGYFGDR